MLIVTFCLLTSCQKATGNEQTSGITNVNKQTSALTTGNNSKGFLLDSDRDKLVTVKDSDIAKLRIGMTIREVKKILKENYMINEPSGRLPYNFCYSWKMSDGDFIAITFEIEGIAPEDFFYRVYLEKDESKRKALVNSAKMVRAIRESNGEILIGETDD